MNKLYKISMCLLLSIAMFSCRKDSTTVPSVVINAELNKKFSPAATYVLENKSEQMPIWVYGKASSDYMILAVHGGPGSDVLDFRNYKDGLGFKQLENNYLVAYWQQRSAGQSLGSDLKKYFTIAQYVEDCDKAIDALKVLYPNKKIILFGHSWGGMLTSSYLKDATRRAKITAWIDAAGATNGKTLDELTSYEVNREADYRISIKQNVDYWTSVKRQLKEDPNEKNALAYSVIDYIPEVPIKVNISDFNFPERALNSNLNLSDEILITDNSASLANVTMPTLFLWGKYDLAVSKVQRDEAKKNIRSTKISSVELTASSHYMMFNEPQNFAKAIEDFITSIK